MLLFSFAVQNKRGNFLCAVQNSKLRVQFFMYLIMIMVLNCTLKASVLKACFSQGSYLVNFGFASTVTV